MKGLCDWMNIYEIIILYLTAEFWKPSQKYVKYINKKVDDLNKFVQI